MAYCPHCAFSVPLREPKITCPNCGRKKVKLSHRKPSCYTTVSAYQEKFGKEASYSPGAAVIVAILILTCALFFLAIGIRVRGPIGFAWDLLGIVSGVVGLYSLSDVMRNLRIDRNPEKGYIDHLDDLKTSREVLLEKIEEVKGLIERQEQHDSERAENRRRLLGAALKNRQLKLALVDETEFIIESRRKISRIEALAQEMAEGTHLRETEKEIERAFTDMQDWLNRAPRDCKSTAGRRIRRSLEEALALHREIVEQLEDRMVMRALNEDEEAEEAFALEKVHEFIEKTSFDANLDAIQMEEVIAADEEYLRINTELRLNRDGIKHDYTRETPIDLDAFDETSLN